MAVNINTEDALFTIDARMVGLMRVALAFSALLIIYIDPAEPDRFVFATYLSLVLYAAYSATVYLLLLRGNAMISSILPVSHWIDVVWYLVFVALSSGTSSIFFFFFFFAILNASFTLGFLPGVRVTIVSAVTFTVLGYLTAPSGPEFELNRFLLRPIYLSVLGYMMAFWGGQEIRIKQRLELLRQITIMSNPRFGVDRTIGVFLGLFKKFYGADECLLVTVDQDSGGYEFHRAENGDPAASQYRLSRQLLERLAALPPEASVIYAKGRRDGADEIRTFHLLPERQTIESGDSEMLRDIAERLDALTYLSVPVTERRKVIGRMFIVHTRNRRTFEIPDLDFTIQALGQLIPVIENIRLVDHLALNAAEEERKRIARDIHDSVIQPYIGIKLGMDSIEQFIDLQAQELANGDGAALSLVKGRVSKLRQLTETTIQTLRGFVQGMSEPGQSNDNLIASLSRFAARYSEATGIRVELSHEGEFRIGDRLAAEIFQIVTEALSNVRKHTHSPVADVELTADERNIVVRVANESDEPENSFAPRSISERVRSLGGFLAIRTGEGKCIVDIEIPL